MEILSAEQIHAWDEYTIAHEPIASLDLMERAASNCAAWLNANNFERSSFSIFCGKGNNGGDGLAIARIMSAQACKVIVYILEFGHMGTVDFQANLARLHDTKVEIRFIQSQEQFHPIPNGDIVIDAIYGSGLNRPLEGVTADLVNHINDSGNTVISIDLPTGLFTDKSSAGNPLIKAKYTLTFQCMKLAFLVAENSQYVGSLHVINIGLSGEFPGRLQTRFITVDKAFCKAIYKPRGQFANKGNFGHALVLAGSYGKIGAAVICAKACLRSGAGLVTTMVPQCGYEIMQSSVPEAMIVTDANEKEHTILPENLDTYAACAIGPGIGTTDQTTNVLSEFLKVFDRPLVIDADALNIIAKHSQLTKHIPGGAVLTPHPKEFERLFGKMSSDFERIEIALAKSKEHNCVIVLKGHHTFVATPDGRGFFNMSGNAGMAKGGTGDALTGVITALLAQRYDHADAAVLGVYLHGVAGDFAATYYSQESMVASDLIECLGQAFLTLQ